MSKIELLSDLLEWKSPKLIETLITPAIRNHIYFIMNRIRVLLSKNKYKISKSILEELDNLPNSKLKYILNAPETCQRVYLAEKDNIKQLLDYLQIVIFFEKCRENHNLNIQKTIWSATADAEISIDKIGKMNYFKSPSYNEIVLDFCSPYSKQEILASNFRPDFGTNVPFSNCEIKKIIIDFNLGMEGLSFISELPYSFVKKLVQSVMPRKDLLNNTFKGSSNRGIIGRVNLINPHLEEVNDGVIASSLLHESIHIYLYLLEEESLLIPDEDFAYNNRVQSPWSLKMINPRAYVHATFVWYSLFNFWLPSKMAERFHPKIRDYFLNFCSKGFKNNESIKRLIPLEKKFPSEVFSALETMTNRMISRI